MLVEVDVELGSHGRRKIDKVQGNLVVLNDQQALEESKAVDLVDNLCIMCL